LKSLLDDAQLLDPVESATSGDGAQITPNMATELKCLLEGVQTSMAEMKTMFLHIQSAEANQKGAFRGLTAACKDTHRLAREGLAGFQQEMKEMRTRVVALEEALVPVQKAVINLRTEQVQQHARDRQHGLHMEQEHYHLQVRLEAQAAAAAAANQLQQQEREEEQSRHSTPMKFTQKGYCHNDITLGCHIQDCPYVHLSPGPQKENLKKHYKNTPCRHGYFCTRKGLGLCPMGHPDSPDSKQQNFSLTPSTSSSPAPSPRLRVTSLGNVYEAQPGKVSKEWQFFKEQK
jgi:hypothetical protein